MKKTTKRIVGVAFGAMLAFTVGAGVYNVYDTQSVITADAATEAIDMTATVASREWAGTADYKEAPLYRLTVPSDTSWGQVIPNENGNQAYMGYIKVNGKTLAQYREEYSELLAKGETSPITWTGMDASGKVGEDRYMQPNIANEVVNKLNACYAPIFVKICYHESIQCNSIDLYIPTSYISDVTSIELSKDFTMTNDAGQTWTLTDKVTWTRNSFGGSKVIGEGQEKTVIETEVLEIKGSYGAADKHLDFILSEHDYASGGQKDVDKGLLASLDYYDYILLDGEKLGTLMRGYQGEVYFNAWGKNQFGTRWPEWMFKEGKVDSVQEITILAGCQFPSYNDPNTVYQTTETVVFTRQENGAFANPNSFMDAEDLQISWAVTAGTKNELYRVDIISELWEMLPLIPTGQTNPDAFDFAYYDNGARDLIRQSIFLNGKSLYEINTTVDDSAYVYSTNPMNLDNKSNDGKDIFKNPTLLEARGNKLILYIHKDYVDSICKSFGDTLTLTISTSISGSDKVGGKILSEDVTAEIYAIGYDLVLMNGTAKLDTLSIKAGNALDNLPEAEADYLTFAGWVDASGNPAPATMPADTLTLYASWNPVPFTATVVQLDGSEQTFTFGLIEGEGVEYTADEMADVVKACLPEETEETGYAFEEKVPSEFQMRDYEFHVTKVKNVFTITFTDEEGNDIGVAPITFTAKTIDSLVLPEVPEKEGYTGAWNKTVDRLKLEDVTLYAVYTEIKEEPEVPQDSTDDSDSTVDSDVEDSATDSAAPGGIMSMIPGCGGVIGGVASGIVALGVATVALLKKKED